MAKVLMLHAVRVVSGFELAPRPDIFTGLDLHKMDVPLIVWELTGSSGLWTKAGRLVQLLRAPYPLCTLPYFFMHT